jgi:hypothetical protein
MVSAIRERGFSAFVWDNNAFGNGTEKFGIFNREKNMSVGNEYALKGICEGAATEYTAISSILQDTSDTSAAVYNLHGQRVQNPQRGIYIRDGKKIVLK